jgi:ankyrin repeat protein
MTCTLADLVESFQNAFIANKNVDAIFEQIRLFGRDPNFAQESLYSKETALHIAVTNNFVQLTRALLEMGCSITTTTNYCVSSLHLAARRDHDDILELFLETGVDVDAIDFFDRQTCLQEAVRSGAHNSVRVLLKYRARTDGFGFHSGFWQSVISYENVLFEFVKAGFDIDQPRKSLMGYNLLQYAAIYCKEKSMQRVIDAGANLDAVDAFGYSALALATTRLFNSDLIVKALLVAGADTSNVEITGEDDFSETILWLAAAVSLSTSVSKDAVLHESIVQKQNELATLIFEKNKRRATDICIALQDLNLPALVTLFIVDALCDPCYRVPMHRKWSLVIAVKHFFQKIEV